MSLSDADWDEINVSGLLHEASCRAEGDEDLDRHERAMMALLYRSMMELSQRMHRRLLENKDPHWQQVARVARALCEQDHPGSCDTPVMPPGMVPMIWKVPQHMYRQVTGNPALDAMIGYCVDVGCLVGSGVAPLWEQYVEISRRVLDAAATTVHPTE